MPTACPPLRHVGRTQRASLLARSFPSRGATYRRLAWSGMGRPIKPRQILYVGLTETSPFETGFIRDHGITRLSPEDLAGSPVKVLEWVRASGANKVAVHFDVDVLDPSLYGFLLFHQPDVAPGTWDNVSKGRMTFEEVACVLRAVDSEADIVGLAIAEYLPWDAPVRYKLVAVNSRPFPATQTSRPRRAADAPDALAAQIHCGAAAGSIGAL